MKRFLSFMLAASLMSTITACKDDLGENITPKFPAAVTGSVTGSGVDNGFTFTVSGNLDWSLTLVDNEDDWFALSDGIEQPIIRGAANEAKEITVFTPFDETFDKGHTCNVVMTMGDESQTVAVVSQGTIERQFILYTTPYDDGEFLRNEDGTAWDYTQTEESFELYFYGSMYQQHAAILANFNWELKSLPDWLEMTNETTDAETGLQKFDLRAATYKIADTEGEIVFADKENTEAEYVFAISIPNYGEVFDMIPNGEAEFDAEGLWNNQGSWDEGGPQAFISAVEGYKVYAFTKVSQVGSSYYDTEGAGWIKVTVDDRSEGDALVHDIRLRVTVSSNTTYDEREGLVMVLPAHVIKALVDGGVAESEIPQYIVGNTVSPEYEDYVFTTIKQAGLELAPIITPTEDKDEMDELGIYFSTVPKNAWFRGNFGNVVHFYQLAYTSSWNNDDPVFYHLDDEYKGTSISFQYYDANAQSENDSWLEALYLSAANNLRISMYPKDDKVESPDYAHEGFILVLSNGTPIACIQCIYDEEFVPSEPDTGDVKIEFVNPDAVTGATLVDIDEANYEQWGLTESEYNESVGMGTALYGLTYTSANPANTTLKTPSGYTIMVMPYGLSWLKTNPGDYEKTKSELTITMTAPGEGETTMGHINIQKNINDSAIDITIYCKPAFAL